MSRTAYVTVVDQHGSPVPGLHASDLDVHEDGKPCVVRRFEAATDAPRITLIVDLFDRSDTQQLQNALAKFILETPPDSQVGIVSLGGETIVDGGYSSDCEVLKRAIARLSPLSDMQLWNRYAGDATRSQRPSYDVQKIISALLARLSGRPAIPQVFVLVETETALNWSRLDAESFDAARRRGVRIDVVRVRADLEPGLPPSVDYADARIDTVLRNGTQATGGRDTLAWSTRGIARELSTIAGELRSRYLLEYSRNPATKPGRLEVAVRRPNLSVRVTPVAPE